MKKKLNFYVVNPTVKFGLTANNLNNAMKTFFEELFAGTEKFDEELDKAPTLPVINKFGLEFTEDEILSEVSILKKVNGTTFRVDIDRDIEVWTLCDDWGGGNTLRFKCPLFKNAGKLAMKTMLLISRQKT